MSQQGGKKRQNGGISARAHAKTWGKGAGWDATFKRTRYGYPSASARLGMQAQASRRARNRVVGSKLTHNATLGYISRGSARRHGLDSPGWTRYIPLAVAAAILVVALAGLGYAGHGESLGNVMAVFKAPSLASKTTQVVEGAANQIGVAPSRAIVAAANAYAERQSGDAAGATDEGASDTGGSAADGSDAAGVSDATDASAGDSAGQAAQGQ